jgi:GGDEF domain-containing protein
MDWNTNQVTFSVAALTCVQTPSSVAEVIQLTDKLMYEVKQAGKDSIRYSVYPKAA